MMAIPLSFQKLNEGKAHSYQAFLKFQTSPCVLALNKAYIVFEVSLCNYQSDLMWRETILVSGQSLDLRQHISFLCSQCSQVLRSHKHNLGRGTKRNSNYIVNFAILITQLEHILSLRSDGECVKKQVTGVKQKFFVYQVECKYLMLNVRVFHWEECVWVEILVLTSFNYPIHLHSTPTNNQKSRTRPSPHNGGLLNKPRARHPRV